MRPNVIDLFEAVRKGWLTPAQAAQMHMLANPLPPRPPAWAGPALMVAALVVVYVVTQ